MLTHADVLYRLLNSGGSVKTVLITGDSLSELFDIRERMINDGYFPVGTIQSRVLNETKTTHEAAGGGLVSESVYKNVFYQDMVNVTSLQPQMFSRDNKLTNRETQQLKDIYCSPDDIYVDSEISVEEATENEL